MEDGREQYHQVPPEGRLRAGPSRGRTCPSVLRCSAGLGAADGSAAAAKPATGTVTALNLSVLSSKWDNAVHPAKVR